MKKITVIVPAYNEEQTIINLLERVNAQSVAGFLFEIIVIDDGSRDGTLAALEDRSDLYDKIVKQTPNQGKGAAVIAGLKQASGDYVLFQDADLEYNPDEYEGLLFPVKEFDADIVMGSRFLSPRYTRVHYFWHKVGNRFITLIFNILFNTTFSDIYSCYLLYRRKLVDPDDLRSTGWEQHAEILARARKKGDVFYEVPISYHGRAYAEGKKIKAQHVIPVIWMIIKQRFFG
ncbi:MAG: glycosyltransferase family 2 protein [Rhodospirillales bacterium]|jgi:glycosyltransferase involved in cell wall biosynthesis|nr:glycosyltransferase family 2 protein [Rhodospirillales bacterium]